MTFQKNYGSSQLRAYGLSYSGYLHPPNNTVNHYAAFPGISPAPIPLSFPYQCKSESKKSNPRPERRSKLLQGIFAWRPCLSSLYRLFSIKPSGNQESDEDSLAAGRGSSCQAQRRARNCCSQLNQVSFSGSQSQTSCALQGSQEQQEPATFLPS